ncbi:hypothetical protein A9P82_14100 [Arachidicoccus ginsenosidimutans]|uniref:HAMP domain-containing histidine kinase n=1 Tax=Arachidicoccus sp. BS20 TaxID=1850526 RepID=UPI0007F0E27C|nr:HAMP domain-containing histidine kinase [Arachidicoccus sp. BS20]ANI90326.1 hypothetical protein A9P82_14100 [Arachidicoccus sp. BS20]
MEHSHKQSLGENKIAVLEQSLRYRNKLIAFLGHEVKGMFANIMWLIEAVESGMASPDMLQELLPELRAVADNNLSVFQKTWEWIKIQEDIYKPVVSVINAGSLYEEINHFFANRLQQKKMKLSFAGDEKLNFLSDPVVVQFVLRKVFENIIKFSISEKDVILDLLLNEEHTLVISIKAEVENTASSVFDILTFEEISGINVMNESETLSSGLLFAKDLAGILGGKLSAAPVKQRCVAICFELYNMRISG